MTRFEIGIRLRVHGDEAGFLCLTLNESLELTLVIT